jgi:hypothetical protein
LEDCNSCGVNLRRVKGSQDYQGTQGGQLMKFYCDYCAKQKTETIFPIGLMSNQKKIMAGIMVCDSHKENAIKQLTKAGNR